jgi:8-oxo-dGTP diphosphatase
VSDVPSGYDPSDYERPSVTVDVVIFTLVEQDLQVLLIRRKRSPFAGYWAIPGGFVGIDESLEAAALRELEEETGVRDVYIEQLYTFGDPDRDPRTRVITVAYFALVPETRLPALRPGDDAADAGWWSMYDLPQLAFDHKDILGYALTRLRYKLEYTAAAFELLPQKFTLSELQSAYEVILGEQLDRGNFRKKLRRADVVEPTKDYRETGGRPARLYRFREDAVAEIKARRLFP